MCENACGSQRCRGGVHWGGLREKEKDRSRDAGTLTGPRDPCCTPGLKNPLMTTPRMLKRQLEAGPGGRGQAVDSGSLRLRPRPIPPTSRESSASGPVFSAGATCGTLSPKLCGERVTGLLLPNPKVRCPFVEN